MPAAGLHAALLYLYLYLDPRESRGHLLPRAPANPPARAFAGLVSASPRHITAPEVSGCTHDMTSWGGSAPHGSSAVMWWYPTGTQKGAARHRPSNPSSFSLPSHRLPPVSGSSAIFPSTILPSVSHPGQGRERYRGPTGASSPPQISGVCPPAALISCCPWRKNGPSCGCAYNGHIDRCLPGSSLVTFVTPSPPACQLVRVAAGTLSRTASA
jgi:hypothetical protein